MPPNVSVIRRMSLYGNDFDDGLFYMHAGGTDGLLHEYTFDQLHAAWQRTSDFVASNGFSASAVSPLTNLSTIHLVNSDGNLQYSTEALAARGSVPQPYNHGATPQQLPVIVYSDSALQLDKDIRIFCSRTRVG